MLHSPRFARSAGGTLSRRLIVAAAATALVLAAVVTFSLVVHHDGPTAPVDAAPPSGPHTVAGSRSSSAPTSLAPIHATDDPEQFARTVAQAIFAWDTATMIDRDDHIEQLIKVADPTGQSTPGLLSDLDDYLPTPDAWLDLAQYDTQQWLSITSIATPSQWAVAQTEAGSELLPGTTAFTIDGIRHRAGVWEGKPVTSTHAVAFTEFIVCGPSYPTCHLLRLSILDKPLG